MDDWIILGAMWTLVVLSNAVALSSLTWLFLTIHGFLTASVMKSTRVQKRAPTRIENYCQTLQTASKSVSTVQEHTRVDHCIIARQPSLVARLNAH